MSVVNTFVHASRAAVIAALALSVASLVTNVALAACPNTVTFTPTVLATVPSAVKAFAHISSPPAARQWTVYTRGLSTTPSCTTGSLVSLSALTVGQEYHGRRGWQ